jgi:hypothetical protein
MSSFDRGRQQSQRATIAIDRSIDPIVLKSMPVQPYLLSTIKERTIQDNLGQRSRFRCKTPRPNTGCTRASSTIHRRLQVAFDRACRRLSTFVV